MAASIAALEVQEAQEAQEAQRFDVAYLAQTASRFEGQSGCLDKTCVASLAHTCPVAVLEKVEP